MYNFAFIHFFLYIFFILHKSLKMCSQHFTYRLILHICSLSLYLYLYVYVIMKKAQSVFIVAFLAVFLYSYKNGWASIKMSNEMKKKNQLHHDMILFVVQIYDSLSVRFYFGYIIIITTVIVSICTIFSL